MQYNSVDELMNKRPGSGTERELQSVKVEVLRRALPLDLNMEGGLT
jgi:hypothetical protein